MPVERVRASISKNIESGDILDRKFLGGLLILVDAYLESRREDHEIGNFDIAPGIDLPETFGRRVAFYRSLRGIAAKELAQEIGITPSHFSRIERDHRRPPSMDKVVSIANQLRLPQDHMHGLLQLAGYPLEAHPL